MLLVLTLLITLALGALPLLSYAANRLVSGQPLMLWQVTAGWLLLLPLLWLWLGLYCAGTRCGAGAATGRGGAVRPADWHRRPRRQ
ncbi:hypothetical protein E05_09170 [Plautia stali symbiont]|nr:hypothetical protein E05_09170 [Plautia stali symbiont]